MGLTLNQPSAEFNLLYTKRSSSDLSIQTVCDGTKRRFFATLVARERFPSKFVPVEPEFKAPRCLHHAANAFLLPGKPLPHRQTVGQNAATQFRTSYHGRLSPKFESATDFVTITYEC